MPTRSKLALASVIALVATVAACGSGDDADGFPAAGAASTSSPSSGAAQPATTGASAGPAGSAVATAAAAGVKLTAVASFDAPLYVTGSPGDTRRLFVVEQGGRIRIVRAGRTVGTPFLDIRKLVTAGGEQGLLSVAFPPDYAKSGLFYVYYTDKGQQQRVVEYRRATTDRARTSSARLVLKMADREPNHNGGLLKFGPDGLLYIGTGDGGGAGDEHGRRGNAQNLASPLGKILRIDPRRSGSRAYSIPADNPFVQRSGARGEIYSYGLRNPWRFSFDRSTGDLSIGDVGQNLAEEIDFVRKGEGRGANFGWRPFEGSKRYAPGESAPDAIGPVIEFDNDDTNCSVTGGYVLRDKSLPASIQGQYVYADFCAGRIRAAKLAPSGATGDRALPLKQVSNLASFGEDASGRVYVVSLSGPVYRLTAR